jgi:N-methylhydantoinase A
MSPDQARRFPVRTALSGPAAGAVGAVAAARTAGRPDVITLDMGGTSTDVALIRSYQTGLSFDREVAGFPVRLPMVDINTIGAGGGSIAWFERDGLLKVGPSSAGAVPGPACYGQGGERPTVTDANLVLGRLSPRGLLGGRMALDLGAARRAVEPVAAQLGFTVEKTAHGILDIVVANMVRAIRAVSVERGHDPRRYTLLPFGGAGALHAGAVARSIGMREIVVPAAPGILCAEGLVEADLREDFVAATQVGVDDAGLGEARRLFAGLEARARAWFAAERIPASRQRLELALDLRYVGQNFELRVAVTPPLPEPDALRQAFFAAHERSYGYHSAEHAVELVNIRLTAIGEVPAPAPQAQGEMPRAAPAPAGTRAVWFAPGAPLETPVYQRVALLPGHALVGPAVIEQFDATTLVHPGDRVTVDAALNLLIEIVP